MSTPNRPIENRIQRANEIIIPISTIRRIPGFEEGGIIPTMVEEPLSMFDDPILDSIQINKPLEEKHQTALHGVEQAIRTILVDTRCDNLQEYNQAIKNLIVTLTMIQKTVDLELHPFKPIEETINRLQTVE